MLTVETWPIGRLVEYGNNPRKNDEQVGRMAKAIQEFGFRIPIVALSSGLIVDGHLRFKAARALGLTEVPVALADGLTEAQIKAFRLLANKSASWAEWNEDLLRVELGAIGDLGIDLALTGFGVDELQALFAPAPTSGQTDPDDTPEPPAEPITRPGDLWLLGEHRLVCGDSTDEASVARLLAFAKPHLMVTDPPYGVEYDANWRNERVRDDGSPIAGRAIGKVLNDERADWREAWALFPGDVAYVWHADLRAKDVVVSLEAARFEMRAQIIWAKGRFAIGRGDYHFQHEPCWYAVRKGKTGHWAGDRKQTTLWEISHSKSETGHSTQKPIECMKRPIENNSVAGDAIYDPFLGSGTTLIAAEMTGRRCFGLELNPAYCDVIVKRWEQFTGRQAERETKDHERAA